MAKIPASEWVWMGHPAHFICSQWCRFHLATRVGDVIVSTLGEYLPDAPVREIYAECRGVTLEGKGDDRLGDYMDKVGFEEIGAGRLYETMVFKAKHRPGDCCEWRQADGTDLDFEGYNDPTEAARGHMAMCEKWAAREKQEEVSA